jgi:hypothetical protein
LDRGSDRYDFLCHFVDDFLYAGPEAQGVVDGIKAKYTVTRDEDIPVYYLGLDVTVNETRTGFILSTRKYMTKCIPQIEALIGRKLGKASTPTIYDWRPAEYDESPLLSPSEVHIHQQVLGKGIWLVTCGRVDIMYAVMTLSRYTHEARKQHMQDLIRIFEYLHKYPNEGLVIEPGEINFTHRDGWDADVNEEREALQEYYPDAHEEWDPHWPEAKGKGVTITIFVDGDHASNKSDRRSITGIIIFIGTMLYKASSKRQTSVEASTFGAEFLEQREWQ